MAVPRRPIYLDLDLFAPEIHKFLRQLLEPIDHGVAEEADGRTSYPAPIPERTKSGPRCAEVYDRCPQEPDEVVPLGLDRIKSIYGY